jgi:hypothetical protein
MGMVAWNTCFRHYSYRFVIAFTVVASAVIGATPLVLIMQWNQNIGYIVQRTRRDAISYRV